MSNPTFAASELKPSQLKSLSTSLDKIAKIAETVTQYHSSDNMGDIKTRVRELTNAQKSLGRVAKSLHRLPDHSEVTRGLTEIEALNTLLEQKIVDINQLQNELAAEQNAGADAVSQLMESSQTQDDIKRMLELKRAFLELTAYLSSTNNSLTHFIYKTTNQDQLQAAVNLIQQSDNLLKEAWLLDQQYAQYIQSSGASSLLVGVKDMRAAKERYLQSKTPFIELFPEIQVDAVKQLNVQLDQVMKTHYNIDMFSENSSNKTSIQLDKARVIAQAIIYQAIGGPYVTEVVTLKDESLVYWEKVKNETDYDIYLNSKEEHHNNSWLTDDATKNND